jgi:DNA-directed RNA polymerase specialized sigma24 family protein
MTKYKRFMAAVGRLQDYRKPNPRPAVEAAIHARRRVERDGIDVAGGMAGSIGEGVSERNLTLAAVRRALADLPKHQRTLLVLICVDGMSYGEAASVLDIPIGAMASRMARARKALHEQIASHCLTDIGGGIPPAPARLGATRGDLR